MNADRLFLEAAVELAEKGRLTCSPNPPVGCLILKNGEVIGRGFHERSGEAHAEISALDSVLGGTENLSDATVYVSLEPCAFEGKTPACAKTLSQFPIKRVVVGAIDPHPDVAGAGVKILRESGIQVDVFELESARRCIEGFRARVSLGRPLVRLKTASSLDGATSLSNGRSRWITSEESRHDVQYWRARSDAIITGVGTVLADDPKLTVRAQEYSLAGQPIRLIFDSQARTPLESKIVDGSAETILAHSASFDPGPDLLALKSVQCKAFEGDRPNISEVMSFLGGLGCNEVLVESGPKLMGAFLEEGVWDEWLLYMAPKILGHDANTLANIKITDIAHSGIGRIAEAIPFGSDLRVRILPN